MDTVLFRRVKFWIFKIRTWLVGWKVLMKENALGYMDEKFIPQIDISLVSLKDKYEFW